MSKALEPVGKTLHISKTELIAKGCSNCFQKLHKQCYHHYEGLDSHPDGYCNEYFEFILGFAEKDDSISAVWEKFNAYKMEVQADADYKRYVDLESSIELAEKQGSLSESDIARLSHKKEMLKMWWVKLLETVQKTRSRIVDREQKSDVHIEVNKISLNQIHQIANERRKELEQK